MTSASLRILGAVILALTLLTGVYLSGKARRDVEQRVGDLREGVDRSEQSGSGRPEEAAPALEYQPAQFAKRLSEDLERFGLEPISLIDLAQPNPRFIELEDAITVPPGKSWSSRHLQIRVRLDKVEYVNRGAKVSSDHVVARIKNVSKVPVAYRLRMRGEAGKCDVRGAREHNAVALRPGEEAEIVVCAGRDKVVVEGLEVLEVTDLGYHYLSEVSPLALGQDAIEAAAHKPVVAVNPCTDVDARALAGYLQAGTARWVDVADFYARHSCHRLQFFPGYRWAEEPLEALPVTPPS